jgi:dephospho-CoA kinase
MTKVIGLTGGIASGKSTVTNFLIEEGYEIIDADKVVARLQAKDGILSQAIRRHFSDEFFDACGNLDRKKLGQLIFSDPEKRSELANLQNEIIRQELAKERELLLEKDKMQGLKDHTFFMDIPLLIEEKYDYFDEIWLISLSKNEQLKRLMLRNDLTEEEALNRINSQMSLSDKKKYADEIIDNDTSLSQLENQVRKLLTKIQEGNDLNESQN